MMISATSADDTGIRAFDEGQGLDLLGASPCSISQEVEDVLALARVVGEPVVIVGQVVLARRDHSAQLKAPTEVARVIETLANVS